ncbi:MAG TPA: pyridoxamine kinase [Lentisphaeria bacterium]|nr:pyridoxamine kinase [Lentisphaerota bacterium]OQC17142.1 MAG: Pyridoxine kinase [Lentisphaerae bacterium ADurb.Bin082]HPY90437.1 pyridoxamine kinase [Lentisphaeria bacterium]HQC51544.1 pyridoxamine kinase [Lentisphaeria bacterium]HQL88185.1 pyridoxamine kinase [Lentisphaeria bacterium]
MQPNVKKVAALHDLSGFGRGSLASIIPALSVMGIQVCSIPTAILSTHSGGFDDYVFHDLTPIMLDFAAHWKRLGLTFDCIYSGFLGSPDQAAIVSRIIDDFRRPETLVVIDPVMGDNGELYISVKPEMVEQMRRLTAKADIITPNITEAALLLNKKPQETMSLAESKDWLLELAALGPRTVIITSVPEVSTEGLVTTVAYERESQNFWKVPARHLPCFYPGTGDLFASVMVGALLQGESLPIAIERSVQFIIHCIQASRCYDYPNRNGVLLEKCLHLLQESCLFYDYERF